MPDVIVGSNTRIVRQDILGRLTAIPSHLILAGNKRALEEISNARRVVFASYVKSEQGELDFEKSVKVAELVHAQCEVGGNILYLSTDHVFSGARGCYSTNDQPDATSTYGQMKMAQEEVFREACIVRFTVLGPSFSERKLLLELIKTQAASVLYPNSYFSPVSTWSISQLIDDFLQRKTISPGIIHLSGNRLSKASVITRLAGLYGLKPVFNVMDEPFVDHSLIATEGYYKPFECEVQNIIEHGEEG